MLGAHMNKLCPHDRLTTAYCEDCAIEGELYVPNRKAQELANNYWEGKPHPDRDLWEYMAERVKVVRRVA